MIDITELILTPNGLKQRSISEVNMELNNDFYAEMAEHATFTRKNFLVIPGWGNAHCRMHKGHDFFSLRIKKIPLRCGWTVTESGILYPDFHRDVQPNFELVWNTPADMELIMMIRMSLHDSVYEVDTQWLLAFRHGYDDAFRLPLANIHDDGRLCDDKEGEGNYHGPTPEEAISSAMTKFAQSGWNTDLWNTQTATQSMFRFLAQGDAHVQQNSIMPWSTLCQIIAPDIIDEVIR